MTIEPGMIPDADDLAEMEAAAKAGGEGGGDVEGGDKEKPTTTPAAETVPKEQYDRLQGQVQQLMQGMATLEGRLQAAAAARPPQEPTPQPRFTDEDVGLGVNAESFNKKLDQMFEAKAQPFVHSVLNNQNAMMGRLMAMDPAMPLYGHVRQQVEQVMNTMPLESRSDPRTWRFVYNNVVSENLPHLLEHVNRVYAKPTPAAPVTEGAGPGSVSPDGSPRGPTLTQEEKTTIAQLRAGGADITEAEYLNMKKAGYGG